MKDRGWIRVSKDLPDNEREVLGIVESGVGPYACVLSFEGPNRYTGWRDGVNRMKGSQKVLYWREIQRLPKEIEEQLEASKPPRMHT